MNEKITDIADGFVKIADNKGRWLRIMGSVIVISGIIIFGFVIYNKSKPKPIVNDCSQEKIELLDFFTAQIVELKLKYEPKQVSYSGYGNGIMFASYDTLKKPKTKIDSLLLKLDSIKKSETKKQKTKS